MPKYTPAPWLIVPTGCDHDSRALCEKGHAPIVFGMLYRPHTGDMDANARLIAAAPDLLVALKRLLDEGCPFAADADSCECGENGSGFDDDGNPCEHIQAYRAVAKAEAP